MISVPPAFHEVWLHLVTILAVGGFALFFHYRFRKSSDEGLACDLILNSINEAVSLIDPQTFKIIEANRLFLQEVGLEREEVLGQTCYRLTHHRESPCQPPDCPCPVFYTLETGEPAIFEHVHRGPQGEKRYVEVSSIPIKSPSGQIRHIVHIARDLTHRRLAEEEIRRLLEKIQRIMDSVPEGVLLLDEGLLVEVVNPLGKEYLDLLADFDSQGRLRRLAGRPVVELLKGEIQELEIKEPSPRTFTVATRPLQAGGQQKGWVVVVREVTLERQLRDRALAQEKLAAVGQLAAGIAHDFNNLLTSIISFAELLKLDPGIPPETQKRLDLIISQGQRAADLTRQILDYSRRSVLKMAPLELSAFLKDLALFLKRTIPENIELRLEIPPGRYTVAADASKLQQALINLALNARDAMPKGGVITLALSRLKVSPKELTPCEDMAPGEWISISVSDTGEGIPPEILPHIFEPFFTTKERGRGTGLGLAQVEGIIRQHRGCLTVETASGQGTTMTIFLKAIKEIALETKAGGGLVPGRGQEILLVEDEESVLEALKASLEALGYQVTVARDGLEALKIYSKRANEIALVLTDMVMPRMNGLELLENLRRLDPQVRIVLLSGYPLGEDHHFLEGLKKVAWLQKPARIEELSQTIARVLSS